MNSNILFETLNKLKDRERKEPMYIHEDENTGQIKEEPLKLDMAASALINKKQNPAKQIHKFMFGI